MLENFKIVVISLVGQVTHANNRKAESCCISLVKVTYFYVGMHCC